MIPGIEMFVHQAARQFEIWTGKPAPQDDMMQVVTLALQERAARAAAAAAAKKKEHSGFDRRAQRQSEDAPSFAFLCEGWKPRTQIPSTSVRSEFIVPNASQEQRRANARSALWPVFINYDSKC